MASLPTNLSVTAPNCKGGQVKRSRNGLAPSLAAKAMRRAIADWVYEGGAGADVP